MAPLLCSCVYRYFFVISAEIFMYVHMWVYFHTLATHRHAHTHAHRRIEHATVDRVLNTFHGLISKRLLLYSQFSNLIFLTHTHKTLPEFQIYLVLDRLPYLFLIVAIEQYFNVIYFRAAFVARSLFERTERFEYLSDTKAKCERRTCWQIRGEQQARRIRLK